MSAQCRFVALERGGVYDNHTNKTIMPTSPEWRAVYQTALSEGAQVAPPTTLPADQDIATIKAIMAGQIKDHATSLRNQYTIGQAPTEVASWYSKASEARVIQSKSESSFATLKSYAPTLCAETEALNLGASQAVLVAELRHLAADVLANHGPYLAFINAVGAASKHHREAIEAIADKGALLQYDWRTDWPEVGHAI